MPTKNKGPLSKVEKFYIDNNAGSPAKQLADDLNRSPKTIEKYLQSSKKETKEHVAKTKQQEDLEAGSLMGKNEKYGVTIMNEQASMAGEQTPSAKSNFNPDTMYRIKED